MSSGFFDHIAQVFIAHGGELLLVGWSLEHPLLVAASHGIKFTGLHGDGGQGFRRGCPGTVPIFVKSPGSVLYQGSRHEDVEVAEIALVADAEIIVADVTPTQDSQLVVGDQNLVVHPAVDAIQVVKILGDPHPARAEAEGIEDAHLDVGMRREDDERAILGLVVVIEQQPYAHARDLQRQ